MRLLVGLLLVVVLAGCADSLPPGNYAIVPVTGTFERPDYAYCEAGNCWYGKMWLSTPTPEEFPVPSPLPTSAAPTPTPIQPKYVCSVGTSGVNVRSGPSTSSSVLFVLQPGQRMLVASELKQDWYEVVYHNAPAYIHKSVSQFCTSGAIVS